MVAGTAEISLLKTLSQNQKLPWGWWDTFEASKPIPVAHHLFQGHISQFFPKHFYQLEPKYSNNDSTGSVAI